MATWPASLPQKLLQSSFGYQPDTGMVESSVDTGPAFRRRRTSANPQKISGSMVMDKMQFATLVDFVENDLAGNVLSFDWNHPLTDDPATFRLGKKPYSVSSVSGKWLTVSLNLELMP